MSKADELWNKLAKKVLEEGFDQDPDTVGTWYVTDGEPAPTRFTTGFTFEFDEGESALMEGKLINIEKPIGEILWIMQDKSNSLELLRHKYDISFWDDWDDGAGTIGKAYGWQVSNMLREFPKDKIDQRLLKNPLTSRLLNIQKGKESVAYDGNYEYKVNSDGEVFVMLDQMDYIIQGMLNFPYSRRYIVNLWDVPNLPNMSLPPCVWNTTWNCTPDGRLHLETQSRSSDIALGLPFNLFQYQVLHHKLARTLNMIPGKYTFHTSNPHIYDRHIEGVKEIISRGKAYDGVESEPKIIIQPQVDRFYDFRVHDVQVSNYDPAPAVPFELAKHTRS